MKKIIPILMLVMILCQAGTPGVRADDTDIYGTTTISLKPNVLIIFDNSGSMSTEDVPGDKYNPAVTYAGTKTTNAVYQDQNGNFTTFTDSVDKIKCQSVYDALTTKGYAATGTGGIDRINTNTFQCGNKSITLRLGNWLNYDAIGFGEYATRFEVAKVAITDLIDTTDNVRFGLMNFHYNNTDSSIAPDRYKNGGKIVKNIGATKAELLDAIKNMKIEMYTPLAETLAEAGLYFAGKNSWYNNGVTYTSPIDERCQKNYIIIMTDGDPTYDGNDLLRTGTYIKGDKIADYDKDGSSGKLDDVAKYLYDNDLRSDMGEAGESFERQNIITYTIGFKTTQTLLQDTAKNGGGEYYTTNSASGLSAAFEEIMAKIADVNAVFVSPVVPVSRMNRTYAGNSLYVGFFKPKESGRWFGNIKKYGLNPAGNIVDKDGVIATLDDGAIKVNATSYWTLASDGPNVLLGGVGGVLSGEPSRSLYTYMGTQAALTNSTNAFSKANAAITATTLGVVDNTAKEAVIDDIYGLDKDWALGDILHSQPTLAHYDTNNDGTLDDSFIFSGSNDGMMHCFKDSTGQEQWGFIPPDQLDRLKLLSDAVLTHDYFVDGSPVVYQPRIAGDLPTNNILFFGERRGGYNYYAIDVTNPESPLWLYKIEPNLLGGGVAQLGQSWSTPAIARIRTGPGTTASDVCNVFLMAGGYDTNQDKPTLAAPAIFPAASDSMGRAVFAIRVSDGGISSMNINAGNFSGMNHCIVDIAGFDIHGHGVVNRAYAGDLGGKMFAFEDNYYNEAYDKLAVKPVGYNKKYVWGDGTWTGRTLFSASADGIQRKILYAPDAIAKSYNGKMGEMIFFGTGDREHPNETNVVNRIYAIKSEWADPAPATLTEADLEDVTNLIVTGTEEEKKAIRAQIDSKKGWYIRLENLGEKVTSKANIFAGVVYFTTYTPESGVALNDPCEAAAGRGQARLYSLDYLTGSAAYDYNVEKDLDGNAFNVKGKEDRSKIISTSMSSSAVIAVLEGGPKMFIGVEGGIANPAIGAVPDLNLFYWRQITN